MKTLYVVRHAKSSWEYDDLSDFERPLNERGKRDAPRMAKRLKEKNVHPDLLVSSPAKRAMSTAKRMAEVLHYKPDHIVGEKKLYHANEDDLLKIAQGLNDKYEVVMLFGHNPGLTDFVNSLSAKKWVTDNIPTCGVVAFELAVSSWSELQFQTGSLLFFDYPKSKDD
jgi:phosphohistidine phosphatase